MSSGRLCLVIYLIVAIPFLTGCQSLVKATAPLNRVSALQPSPDCPREINLRSHFYSFSYENLYCLSKGKIWVKSNEMNTGVHDDWRLFSGTGVPVGPTIHSFDANDCISEIDQEATFLVALSCKGRYYIWTPTDLSTGPHWEEAVGAPFSGALTPVPAARDWAFSFSSAPSPDKTLPMSPENLNLYWEDADNNKSEFGLTATIYSLDQEGQIIRYWDTGLPNSFSRGFVTPERGRFIADRIIASGSTILVIDSVGRMFTRMYDYEINTALPGIKVTYLRAHRTDEVLSLQGAVRTLPLPDWREQERIPVSGAAIVTRAISMHVTGNGNKSREIRVKGRNELGQLGYWRKAIFDTNWQFTVSDEIYNEADVVRQYGAPPSLGRVIDNDYSGKLVDIESSELEVSLINFHYFNSPSILRVRTAQGTHFDLILHTADMWGLLPQEAEDPRQIGRPYGQPKLLYGTLVIPDSVLHSHDPEIDKIVKEYFLRFHYQTFALELEADEATVKIASQLFMRRPDAYGGSTRYLDFVVKSPIYATLQNKKLMEVNDSDPVSGSFGAIDAKLDHGLENNCDATSADLFRIQQELAANQMSVDQLEQNRSDRKLDYLSTGLVNTGAALVWKVVDPIAELLGIQMWWPRNLPPGRDGLASAMVRGGDTFWLHAKLDLSKVLTDPDYKQTTRRTNERTLLMMSDIQRIRGEKHSLCHSNSNFPNLHAP